MESKEELKSRIKSFRDGLKECQEVCQQIWDDRHNYREENDKLLEQESKLREELTEEWGHWDCP